MSSRSVVIAVVLWLALAGRVDAAIVPVSFTARDVVAPVVAVDVFAAGEPLDVPVPATVTIDDAGVVVGVDGGRDVVVQFILDSGAYLLDGPTRWPLQPEVRSLPTTPRRSVGGSIATTSSNGQVVWIDERGVLATAQWPRCWIRGRRWECLGIPEGEGGLAVLSLAPPLLFATVTPGAGSNAPPSGNAAWATVLVVDGDGDARVRMLKPFDAKNTAAYRVPLEPATGCSASPFGAAAFLIACSQQEDIVLEVTQPGMATSRTAVDSVSASVLSPVVVLPAPERLVIGRVEGADHQPARGARLEVSELVDIVERDGRRRTVRRSVGEGSADEDARFELRGLGEGRYEVLAVHERLGRGRVQFEDGSRAILIRLTAPFRVTGRVVRRGVPVARARVDVPPDYAAYAKSVDPFDVVSLESTTGSDGRFELALPPRGATEVRVTFGRLVARRVLPASSDTGRPDRIDVGDIELPPEIVVSVTYVGDDRCGLVAAGPLGKSGVAIVDAVTPGPGRKRLSLPEPGDWILAAKCGGREFRVEPRVLEVPENVTEWGAHVTLIP